MKNMEKHTETLVKNREAGDRRQHDKQNKRDGNEVGTGDELRYGAWLRRHRQGEQAEECSGRSERETPVKMDFREVKDQISQGTK